MIEKFNFYDVYGYFLPGAALFALIWLPFGFTKQQWPPTELASAIAAIVTSYVLGHLLQALATNALPSHKARHATGTPRYPSEILLDSDGPLPAAIKQSIEKKVKEKFGLDLQVTQVGSEPVDSVRRNAFAMCRHVLVREKLVNYGEQFQGMYALMRGLATAFLFSFSYSLGWAAAFWHTNCFVSTAIIVVGVLLVTVIGISAYEAIKADIRNRRRETLSRWSLAVLVLAFLPAGYLIGTRQQIQDSQSILLLSMSLIALWGFFRAFASYKYFADHFAKAVWLDFLALREKQTETGGHPSD